MKKVIYLWGLCVLPMLLILGCSDKNESELTAKKKDFENALFVGNRYQFQIDDDKLLIMGNNFYGEKYSFDDLLFEDGIPDNNAVFLEFDHVKVKTKGVDYFITADGISFKLKKFKNHIVMDEEGNEFIRNEIKLD